MRVREYALEQIHWILRTDPWVREIFLAAGLPLDGLAERILDGSIKAGQTVVCSMKEEEIIFKAEE